MSASIENIGPATVVVFTDKDNVVKAKSLKTGQIVAYGTSGNSTNAINNGMYSGLTSGRLNQETIKIIGSHNINRISVPSNTVFDATEASFFLISGTNDHMLCNFDASGVNGGNSGITVLGGFWNGNRSGNSPNSNNYYVRNMFHFDTCTNVRVEGCTLARGIGNAILINNCNQVWVEKNRTYGHYKLGVAVFASGYSGTSSGTANVFIRNNYWDDMVENFVASLNASDVIVEGNIGTNTSTVPINMNGPRSKILNNIFVVGLSGYHGIALSPEGTFSCDDSEIRGNSVYDVHSGHGLAFGVSNPCDRVTVADNLIVATPGLTDGPFYGIRATHTHNSTVSNNRVEGFPAAGISVEGVNFTLSGRLFDTDGVIVENNIVVNCGRNSGGNPWARVGISIFGDSGYNNNIKVCNNIAYDTSGALGMQMYGLYYNDSVDVIIHDNDFRNNVSGGVQNGGGNTNTTLYNNLGDSTNNLSGNYSNMVINTATINSSILNSGCQLTSPYLNRNCLASGFTLIAVSGGAEAILTLGVQDNGTDRLFIENATSNSGAFAPSIRGLILQNSTSTPLFNIGSVIASGDTGNVPLIVMDGRQSAAQAVTRPLFAVTSFAIHRVLFMLSGANFQSGMQLNLQDKATFSGSTQLVNTVNFQASGALSTSGTTGSGGALPGNPFGYITIQVSGVNRKVAYYDV